MVVGGRPVAAAERDGRNAAGTQPVGVEAAVADGADRHEADDRNGPFRFDHARFVVRQLERLIIEPMFNLHRAAGAVAHGVVERLGAVEVGRRRVADRGAAPEVER